MKNRQPLFHVVKREGGSPGRQLLAYVAAVALALAVGALLLAVQGWSPSPSISRCSPWASRAAATPGGR